MSNDLNVQQSGKSGGDAFGWSASGSAGIGGAGTVAASSFGGLFGDAQGQDRRRRRLFGVIGGWRLRRRRQRQYGDRIDQHQLLNRFRAG